MSKSRTLTETFTRMVNSARWQKMTPDKQAEYKRRYDDALNRAEAEERAQPSTEAAQVSTPTVAPARPEPAQSEQSSQPPKSRQIAQTFNRMRESDRWKAMSEEQQLNYTERAKVAHRRALADEGVNQDLDAKQIEQREVWQPYMPPEVKQEVVAPTIGTVGKALGKSLLRAPGNLVSTIVGAGGVAADLVGKGIKNVPYLDGVGEAISQTGQDTINISNTMDAWNKHFIPTEQATPDNLQKFGDMTAGQKGLFLADQIPEQLGTMFLPGMMGAKFGQAAVAGAKGAKAAGVLKPLTGYLAGKGPKAAQALGALTGSTIQSAAEIGKSQMQEAGDTNALATLIAAPIAGKLESLVPASAEWLSGSFKGASRKAFTEAMKSPVKFLGHVSKEMLKSGTTESATELLQESIQKYATEMAKGENGQGILSAASQASKILREQGIDGLIAEAKKNETVGQLAMAAILGGVAGGVFEGGGRTFAGAKYLASPVRHYDNRVNAVTEEEKTAAEDSWNKLAPLQRQKAREEAAFRSLFELDDAETDDDAVKEAFNVMRELGPREYSAVTRTASENGWVPSDKHQERLVNFLAENPEFAKQLEKLSAQSAKAQKITQGNPNVNLAPKTNISDKKQEQKPAAKVQPNVVDLINQITGGQGSEYDNYLQSLENDEPDQATKRASAVGGDLETAPGIINAAEHQESPDELTRLFPPEDMIAGGKGQQGAEVAAREIPGKGYAGKKTKIRAGDITTDGEYAIVELDGLQRNQQMGELQNRDRTRDASKAQIESIAANPDPDKLISSDVFANDGPMVVGPDFVVESGNGRTEGLNLAYQKGTAGKYTQALAQRAAEFGIDPQTISKMKKPVLVRIRAGEIENNNRSAFVAAANAPRQLQRSATEKAVTDGQAILDFVGNLETTGSNINTAANRPFLAEFFDRVAAPEERGALFTASGELSQEGLNRVRNAVFAGAYGSPELLVSLTEDTDSEIKSIINGLLEAAPDSAALSGEAKRGGVHQVNLTAPLAEAAKKIAGLRQQGQKVEAYFQQGQFGSDKLNPESRILLGLFSELGSAKRINDFVRAFNQTVRAYGSPAQMQIPGMESEPPTVRDVMTQAIRKTAPELEAKIERWVQGPPSMGVEFSRKGDTKPSVALFSREKANPTASTEISRDELNNVAASIQNNLDPATGIRIVVVENTGELSKATGYHAPGDVEGAIQGQTVYLVRENMPDATRAKEVAGHEIIGHFGLQTILGREWAGFSKSFWDLGKEDQAIKKELDGAAQDYIQDEVSAAENMRTIIDEALARTSERFAFDPEKFSDRVREWFNDTVSNVQDLLRTMGIEIEFNVRDLAKTIRSAKSAVTQDGKFSTGSAESKRRLEQLIEQIGSELPPQHKETGNKLLDILASMGEESEQPKAPEYTIEKDLSGDPRFSRKGVSGKGPAKQLEIDFFQAAQEEVGADKAEAQAEPPAPILEKFFQVTENVRLGSFKHNIKTVKSPADIASILAPIASKGKETFLAVVLNNKKAPISILKVSIGGRDQTSAIPIEVLGGVSAMPGAAGFYVAHNHPSGTMSFSNADRNVARKFKAAISGTGIDYLGSLILGDGHFNFSDENHTEQSAEKIPTAAGKKTAAVLGEPEIKERSRQKALGMAQHVYDHIKDSEVFARNESGVLLLDNQNRVLAEIAMPISDMLKLRTGQSGTGATKILAAMDRSNATGILAVMRHAGSYAESYKSVSEIFGNMAAFARDLDVRFLDALAYDPHAPEQPGSLRWISARENGAPEAKSPYFSKKKGAEASGPKSKLESALEALSDEQPKYSYAGTRAKRPKNIGQWKDAKARLDAGEDPETVRLETGWFVNPYDNQPRFEIDDSRASWRRSLAVFSPEKTNYTEHLQKKYKNRNLDKILSDLASEEEVSRYYDLPGEGLKNAGDLGEFLKHDELFAAYPDLAAANVLITINPAAEREGAAYQSTLTTPAIIEVIAPDEDAAREILLHETQHLIQQTERFARGGNSKQFADGTIEEAREKAIRSYREKAEGIFLGASPEFRAAARRVNRAIEAKLPADQQSEEYYSARKEFADQFGEDAEQYLMNSDFADQIYRGESDFDANGKYIRPERAYEKYRKLAGEIEARDTADRADLSKKERKLYPPFSTAEYEPDEAIVRFSKKGDQEFRVYSEMERTLTKPGMLPKKASKADMISAIQKHVGKFKKVELDESGLIEHLQSMQDDSATSQDVADYLDMNRIELEEVQKTEESFSGTRQEFDGLTEEEQNGYADTKDKTRHPTWQVPGGENYRELLLVLPSEKAQNKEISWKQNGRGLWAWHDNDRQISGAFPSENDAEDARQSIRRDPKDVFGSSHWSEDNVLLHVRFNERDGLDGERVLFIEEVQSDWHQAGRKEGYRTVSKEALDAAISRRNQMAKEQLAKNKTVDDFTESERAEWDILFETIQRGVNGAIPDAPFKATDRWAMLGMKRMIQWAVDNGFDRVAWTPGETQAERYDLSKQISEVIFEDNQSGGIGLARLDGPPTSGQLIAFNNDRRLVINQHIQPDQLEDYIGKDAAKKLLEQQPQRTQSAGIGVRQRKLSGIDLKVGGDGMKSFYDNILKNETAKYVKKWGAKVGEVDLPASDDGFVSGDDVMADMNIPLSERQAYWANLANEERDELMNKYRNRRMTAHGFDITPAMRESVAAGQPLYSKKGNAGADPFDPTPEPLPTLTEETRTQVGKISDAISKIAGGLLGDTRSQADRKSAPFQRSAALDPNASTDFELERENKIAAAVKSRRFEDKTILEHLDADKNLITGLIRKMVPKGDLQDWMLKKAARVLAPYQSAKPIEKILFTVGENITWDGSKVVASPGIRSYNAETGEYEYQPGEHSAAAMHFFNTLSPEWKEVMTERAKENEEYRQNFVNVIIPHRKAQVAIALLARYRQMNADQSALQEAEAEARSMLKAIDGKIDQAEHNELKSLLENVVKIPADRVAKMVVPIEGVIKNAVGELKGPSALQAELKRLNTNRGHYGYVHHYFDSDRAPSQGKAFDAFGRVPNGWIEETPGSQKLRTGIEGNEKNLLKADIARSGKEAKAEAGNNWMRQTEDQRGLLVEQFQDVPDDQMPEGYSERKRVVANFGSYRGKEIYLPDGLYDYYKLVKEKGFEDPGMKDFGEVVQMVDGVTNRMNEAMLYHPGKAARDLMSAPFHMLEFLRDWSVKNPRESLFAVKALTKAIASAASPTTWQKSTPESHGEYSESLAYQNKDGEKSFFTKAGDSLGSLFTDIPVGSTAAAFLRELNLSGAADLPMKRIMESVGEQIADKRGLKGKERERFVYDMLNDYAFVTQDLPPILSYLRGQRPTKGSRAWGAVMRTTIPFLGYSSRLAKQMLADPISKGAVPLIKRLGGRKAADADFLSELSEVSRPFAWLFLKSLISAGLGGLIPPEKEGLASEIQDARNLDPLARTHGRVLVRQDKNPDGGENWLSTKGLGQLQVADALATAASGKSSIKDFSAEFLTIHPTMQMLLGAAGLEDPYSAKVPMTAKLGRSIAQAMVPQLTRFGPEFAKFLRAVSGKNTIPDANKQTFFTAFFEQMGIPAGEVKVDRDGKIRTTKNGLELLKLAGVNIRHVPYDMIAEAAEDEVKGLDYLVNRLEMIQEYRDGDRDAELSEREFIAQVLKTNRWTKITDAERDMSEELKKRGHGILATVAKLREKGKPIAEKKERKKPKFGSSGFGGNFGGGFGKKDKLEDIIRRIGNDESAEETDLEKILNRLN